MKLKAPWPAMGGKSAVADYAWERIGDVQNAIEPFALSMAWMLHRPAWHTGRIETINDINHYVVNFWRAVRDKPREVARYCDNPVTEADLHARHRWLELSETAARHKRKIITDPAYSSAKIAGWWAWGQSSWIGGGWCTGQGRTADGGFKKVRNNAKGRGVVGQRKTVTRMEGASGVNQKKMADISRPGNRAMHTFASRKKPKGKNAGLNELGGGQTSQHRNGTQSNPAGVNGLRGRPQLGDAYDIGRGVNSNVNAGTCAERREFLEGWMQLLADRCRLMRIMYGHWSRICGSETTTTRLGLTGIFLDPPYPTHGPDGKRSRDGHLYHGDDRTATDLIRDEVLAYCVKHGTNRMMRIAVCGYDTDGYAVLERRGWTCYEWRAQGGYGNRQVAAGRKNVNRTRERIWFSPHCVSGVDLFSGAGAP
jgi:DNA adenine methylase